MIAIHEREGTSTGVSAPRVGLQLYTVREDAARDLEGTIRWAGQLAIDGVELAGLHGHDPRVVRAWLDEAGLVATSTFVAMAAVEDQPDAVYGAADTLGTDRIVVEWLPPTHDSTVVASYVERLGRACRAARAAGFRLGFHTHDAELGVADDGSVMVDRLIEDVPEIEVELDLGWAWIAGAELGAAVRKLGARCAVVHVKDFADVSDPTSFVSVGEGAVPFDEALAAARHLEWLVAEQDAAFLPDARSAAERSISALVALRDAVFGPGASVGSSPARDRHATE